jgi:hypothetical protein
VTRAGQIIAALEFLGPPPRRGHEDRRRHVERVVDIMEGARRPAAHAKVTRKRMRAYSDALRQFQAASKAHAAVGGVLAFPLPLIRHAVALDKVWSAHWHPPSRWLEHKTAVQLAYALLICWKPRDVAVSRNGTWHKLSAVLFGNPRPHGEASRRAGCRKSARPVR